MWKEKTYLVSIKNHLTENLLLVKDHFMNLSAGELNRKPGPKQWSIAQCLDHLIHLDRLYIREVRQALDRQDYKSRGKMFHPSLLGRIFIKSMKPGGRRKRKTLKIFKPREGEIRKSVMDEFEQHQSELMELLILSEGRDLNRIKVQSPAISLLKFKLGDVFSMLALHQRRHINQALKVKETALDKVEK